MASVAAVDAVVCERFELLSAVYQLRSVRRKGRPIDVLAAVDDILEQLDRPAFSKEANQVPDGYNEFLERQRNNS